MLIGGSFAYSNKKKVIIEYEWRMKGICRKTQILGVKFDQYHHLKLAPINYTI